MLRYFVMPFVCAITSAVAVGVADVAVLRLLRYFSIFPTCNVFSLKIRAAHTIATDLQHYRQVLYC